MQRVRIDRSECRQFSRISSADSTAEVVFAGVYVTGSCKGVYNGIVPWKKWISSPDSVAKSLYWPFVSLGSSLCAQCTFSLDYFLACRVQLSKICAELVSAEVSNRNMLFQKYASYHSILTIPLCAWFSVWQQLTKKGTRTQYRLHHTKPRLALFTNSRHGQITTLILRRAVLSTSSLPRISASADSTTPQSIDKCQGANIIVPPVYLLKS